MQSSGASPTGRPIWGTEPCARRANARPRGPATRWACRQPTDQLRGDPGVSASGVAVRPPRRSGGAGRRTRHAGGTTSRAPGWARASSRRSPNVSRTTAAQRGSVLTVVVPARRQAHSPGVRELVAKGLPFDPARTALTQHQLLLTEHEAIFVFDTWKSQEGLKALLGLELRQLDRRSRLARPRRRPAAPGCGRLRLGASGAAHGPGGRARLLGRRAGAAAVCGKSAASLRMPR